MKDGRRVILYIDDDQDYLDMMRAILEDGGYEMVEARTAEEGLKAYASVRPDLVMVDLMMEEVDSGTSLVKEIRAVGDPVPIVMISSVGDHLSTTTDYTALGLAGLLQKPIDAATLLALLSARLEK
jgi:two-component system alkaline phosphatase synthesis response regulator PhoP